jgi:hypothetical protein
MAAIEIPLDAISLPFLAWLRLLTPIHTDFHGCPTHANLLRCPGGAQRTVWFEVCEYGLSGTNS